MLFYFAHPTLYGTVLQHDSARPHAARYTTRFLTNSSIQNSPLAFQVARLRHKYNWNTDTTSFSFSSSSAATFFLKKPQNNWSWNQAKSASYCLLYAHSSHNERWRLFLCIATIGRAMSSWPTIKSHRLCLVIVQKKKKRRKKVAPFVVKCRLFSFSADGQAR